MKYIFMYLVIPASGKIPGCVWSAVLHTYLILGHRKIESKNTMLCLPHLWICQTKNDENSWRYLMCYGQQKNLRVNHPCGTFKPKFVFHNQRQLLTRPSERNTHYKSAIPTTKYRSQTGRKKNTPVLLHQNSLKLPYVLYPQIKPHQSSQYSTPPPRIHCPRLPRRIPRASNRQNHHPVSWSLHKFQPGK